MARSEENNTLLYGAIGVSGMLLVVAVVAMKFLTKPPPPPPPPPPPAAETTVTQTLRFTPGFLKATLEETAKRYGVSLPPMEVLGRPLLRTVEIAAPRGLKPGESIETAHLRVSARVEKAWAKGGDGQGFRYDHLIVTITNKSDVPIAYRVDTKVDSNKPCNSQGAITHNAIGLLPGEKVERAECLYNPGLKMKIDAAETVELTELGYYFVSRLPPQQIGLELRTAQGHSVPKGLPPCKFVPWREIESGGAAWADVIDFYARHDCDEYSFFKTYRFRTEPVELPVREAGAVKPAPPAAPPPPPPPAP